MVTGNTGKGIYLSDTPEASKYYGKLSVEEQMLKKGDFTGEIPEPKVMNINVSKDAKIKQFDKIPSESEVKLARKEGYDGIRYPDEITAKVEGKGIIPESNTTMMFDSSKIEILNKAEDNLIQEAKKYKSAEEFVYHTTPAENILSIQKEGLKSGGGQFGKGTYFGLS